MRQLLWVLTLLPVGLWGADGVVAELANRIRQAGLDADECYRIREINFTREDLRIYLTEGYIIFGKPVNGRRISAVFTSDIEGGDGELLVMPPIRSERLSLATFTESPNLNEHFTTAHMLFTDDTAEELAKLIRAKPRVRRSPEIGHLLKQKWDLVIGNLVRSLGIRLTYDILSGTPRSSGLFYAVIRGKRLGIFDVIYDALAQEQIKIGQVLFRNKRAYFDMWTSFHARSFRNGRRGEELPRTPLDDYRIDATLDKSLHLSVTTKARLSVEGIPQEVLFFGISPTMKVTSVLLDGQACEVWRRDSLRANLFQGGDNNLLLVVAPQSLEPGQQYEIEFRHEGRVVTEAGNGVYFVGSRGSWYPRHDLSFSRYDVTFRYPTSLDLVFAGELLDDRTEGEWRITRRRTETPIRLVGFNIGEYEKLKVDRAGYSIEVYANREVETALQPKKEYIMVPRPESATRPGGRTRELVPATVIGAQPNLEKPDPTARLEEFASVIGDAYEFMTSHFGPPPTRTLTVSPIPGMFGQGFPGLLYISTLAYLDPGERPVPASGEYVNYFLSEMLHAHEVAHQWWGNIVSADGNKNEWLMEALADYSALMILEKTEGYDALHSVLSEYRSQMLVKNEEGRTLESAGPISWGQRLDSSQARAWRTITYQKGAWIIHMLRRCLGSERFLEMLGELCRRYRYHTITIEDFRKLATEFLPKNSLDPTLEEFYDRWIYGVGLPTLKFSRSVKGKSPKVRVWGTITQTEVGDDFSIHVPIEFKFADGESIVRWIRTDNEPAPFDFTFRQRPSEIVFNPGDSVLAVHR